MTSEVTKRGRGVVVSRWLTRSNLMAIAGFALMLAVWNFIMVPSWLRGEWDPSSKLMRLLYQCQGTPEQEAVRWGPRRMVVSACKKPILIAESDDHRRVLILNRADSQYVVLDPGSGQVVYTVSAHDFRVRSLVGDRYLYATSVLSSWESFEADYIVDINTDTFVPMTQVPWEIEDISLLVNEYESSRRNVIQVIGTPQALLFIHSTNEFTAFKLTTPPPATIRVLIDNWDAPVLLGQEAMRDRDKSAGGGEDCVIGENRYVGDNNPFSLPRSTICLFRFALPVVTKP